MFRFLIQKAKLAQRQVLHRLYINPKLEGDIVKQFHKLYYDSHVFGKTWSNTWWFGHKLMKCPLDLWLYQEILFKLRPEFIIETGTYQGGSAHYLASLCDMLGKGQIITVDIDTYAERPTHDRITYINGSSTDPVIVKSIEDRIAGKGPVLVILDSDHSRDHVLKEMQAYEHLVGSGSYIIVEDTDLNGHPVWPEHGPGPMEAVELFLKDRKDFANDPEMEKFLLSSNPKGYLKRK